MICARRWGLSVSVVGYRRTTELASPIGRCMPSIWLTTRGSEGPGPDSTTVTRHLGSAERRSARTDPALPAPTISTSLCKAGSGPNLGFEGACVPFAYHAGPQAGAVGDIVEPLQQHVGEQAHPLRIVVGVAVAG